MSIREQYHQRLAIEVDASAMRGVPVGRQRGAALAVSLILMVAMTLVGVAMLSSTRLNERISGNAQQKAMAFEVVESGISSVWSAGFLRNLLATTEMSSNKPEAITIADSDTGMASDFDIVNAGLGTDIEGSLTVQYCGEVAPLGTSLNTDESMVHMVALLVDIRGQASIANTGTHADHVQRAALTSPQTGRTGNCPAP